LFEALPNCLVCDSMFFVHGGIPRSDTMAEKWRGIQSLNDREMRFQMLWSDPSDVDVVPTDLQKQSARFPFGRKQFQQFMSKVGCRMMVRGHERVTSGFSKIYNDPEGVLVSLFSAGGEHNDDLPKRSNYRQVTPMALSIRYQQGATTLSPFLLDYGRYNQPEYNAFFKDKLAT
ncbi:MAG: serine/threonine protein phosphatase, partial [Deltaproteobacteria bacterium]